MKIFSKFLGIVTVGEIILFFVKAGKSQTDIFHQMGRHPVFLTLNRSEIPFHIALEEASRGGITALDKSK